MHIIPKRSDKKEIDETFWDLFRETNGGKSVRLHELSNKPQFSKIVYSKTRNINFLLQLQISVFTVGKIILWISCEGKQNYVLENSYINFMCDEKVW